MFLTLAEIQAFINFVNGNLGKKMFTDASPASTVAGKKLLTTGVGLGVELVDDISTQLGIAGTWDMSTLSPPTGVKIGERYFVTTKGTFNGVPALVGDVVEFVTLTSIFVYPLAATLVRLSVLDDYATKAYAEGLVVGLLDDRGGYDPTVTDEYPTNVNNGSGVNGDVMKGDLWFFTADGICGANTVLTGYSVRALVDSPGQTDSNWDILNVGLGYAPENVDKKKTSLNGALSSPNDTDYPSTLVVDDALNLKADILDQTHTGNMRLPSALKIYDVVSSTKEVAVDVSGLTAGAPRTVTFPDRNIELGDLPLFAATTNYGQYAIIQQDGLLYSAKVAFTSGASFSVSDWDSIGGVLKSQITASQDIVSGYEYFIVASPNVAITLETPDPSAVPDGSRIVIHNLAFNAVATLGKTNWTAGTGFAVAPSFDTVATATIPSYSKGATTVLTSRQSTGVWVKETTYGSTTPVGTTVGAGKAYFAREDDVTATVSFDLGGIPAATNTIVTFPNANVDLGKIPTALTYSQATTVLTHTNTDGSTLTANLAPISEYASGAVYSVGAQVSYLGHLWRVIIAHTGAIPFVNGNLELIGSTFCAGQISGAYTAIQLGATASPPVDKVLEIDLTGVTAHTINLDCAPRNVRIQVPSGKITKEITLTRAAIDFCVDDGTVVGTGTYTFKIVGGDIAYIYQFDSQTMIMLRKQHSVQRFMIIDAAASGIGTGVNGWKFSGSASAVHTITLPAANINLGQQLISASYDTSTGLVTFTKAGGTNTSIDMSNVIRFVALPSGIAPAQPNVSTLFMLTGSITINIDGLSSRTWEFQSSLDRTITLTKTSSAPIVDREGNTLADSGTTSCIIALSEYDTIKVTGFGTYWVVEYGSRRLYTNSGALGLVSKTGAGAGSTKYKTTFVRSSGTSFASNTTITLPDANVNLGDIPSISNFNSNTVSNNGTILSRNSSSNAVNGVVLLSGDSLKTGFGYTIAGAVVAQTGKGSASYFRPAVFDTLLTDYTSSQISRPLTLTSVAGTANKPYAGAPAGDAFWALAGGLDHVAVHTLTFACSVFGGSGTLGVFSGQRRIMVRRLNATDTYIIDNIQTIGTDAVSAGITGVSVAITLDSDRLNIVISQTTATSNQILTSAELHTLVTSLG